MLTLVSGTRVPSFKSRYQRYDIALVYSWLSLLANFYKCQFGDNAKDEIASNVENG